MANWQYLWFNIFLYNLLHINGLQDNRCYSESGNSKETFFPDENLSINETIAVLPIIGDPKLGNIELSLKDPDGYVNLVPGTKNLTLRKPLDREGIHGISSFNITLICVPAGKIDPVFLAISIKASDVNDNAPEFQNTPYILNISEVTIVGSRVLQGIQAIDQDQTETFSKIKYSILPGPNSDYFAFENEYQGTLILKKPIDYEKLKKFELQIRAQDHGEPPQFSDTILMVNVLDADDQNPRFLDKKYTAIIGDRAVFNGTILKIHPRDIKAVDQDEGINAPVFYTWDNNDEDSSSSVYSLFRLDRKTGKVSLTKTLNDLDLIQQVLLLIRATQLDNPDRYAVVQLQISRTKATKFFSTLYTFRAAENLNSGSVIGNLTNNHQDQRLKYYVSDKNILDLFGINKYGQLILKGKLDYETKTEYNFQALVVGKSNNDSTMVKVLVENINEWEPRFRYSPYEFFAGINEIRHNLIGRIEVADADYGDQLNLTLSGPNAAMFFITPNGELRIRDLKGLNGHTASLTVTATDSGNPQKTTSVPINVYFQGAKADSASSASTSNNRNSTSNSASILLVGLGTILLVLSLIVALLVAYICKVKRKLPNETDTNNRQNKEKQSQMHNPVFGNEKSSAGTTAVALGGIPTKTTNDRKKTGISPKIHPAPQPPPLNTSLWPTSVSRVKKLSWGDKTDTESNENLNQLMNEIPKVLENNNLTVYF